MSMIWEEVPIAAGLIGASCNLSEPQLRERLTAWRELRDRAQSIEVLTDRVRLILDDDEPIDAVADLAGRESECCAFYAFTIQIEGPARRLDISAGPGGELAVRGLLGLD